MTPLVGVAAVVLVAWFAAGTIWNVRKGGALLRWMQGGLPQIAPRTTVRWLGSSVVQMALQEPKAPFSSASVVIFLEPRDLPWWPLSRARGRRDTLIVRAGLRRAPRVELEALAPGSWSARDAESRVPREWLKHESDIVVRGDGPAALERAAAMLRLAEDSRLEVKRLSVRREEPNFQLHVAFPDAGKPAREFFELVHDLSELALS